MRLKEGPSQTDVLKGTQIDIRKKQHFRPSTAVIKHPQSHIKAKIVSQSSYKDSFLKNQVSGWDDLTDSF